MKKLTLVLGIVSLLYMAAYTALAQSYKKSSTPSFSTKDGLQKMVEDFAMDNVPLGDLVGVLKDSPEYTKAGLTLWLNRKMADAAAVEDWGRHDRYMAFYICHTKNNCDLLRELQAETGKPEHRKHWMKSMGRCTCEDWDKDNRYGVVYNDPAKGKSVLVPNFGTLSACKQLAVDASNCHK